MALARVMARVFVGFWFGVLLISLIEFAWCVGHVVSADGLREVLTSTLQRIFRNYLFSRMFFRRILYNKTATISCGPLCCSVNYAQEDNGRFDFCKQGTLCCSENYVL